ncbi:MAG TPA: zinc ribbon domain-containing protein [Euryarchaeota archaeon]|nr:zinc ribbon domain-containing protein [Euryarchaeota archaeon]
MSEDRKCPVCYLPLPSAGEKCPMCGTLIGKMGVIMPDRERKKAPPPVESLTKKELDEMKPVLEEFMAIPGMTPEGAYRMYQSWYRSLSEIIKGAFHNDEEYSVTSKLLANRILAESMESEDEERNIPCPFCKSPVPSSSKHCNICGESLSQGIEALDGDFVEMQMENFAGNLLDRLKEDPDFSDLPEELRSQIIDVVGEDLDVDITPSSLEEKGEEAGEGTAQKDDPKKKRYREKLKAWKEKGVDPLIIDDLEKLLDSDFERFKVESVKILREKVKELKVRKKDETG